MIDEWLGGGYLSQRGGKGTCRTWGQLWGWRGMAIHSCTHGGENQDQKNESYLQMIVKYNPRHKFSVSPLWNTTCSHLQCSGERNERLGQGSHVNLRTRRQNDQIRVDGPMKNTSRSEVKSGGDGGQRVGAVVLHGIGESYHEKKKIESPSWTSSSAAQAHYTLSCKAE